MGRARTGRPRVKTMWLSMVSRWVSGAWYVSEALSSLSQPDIVVIWLKPEEQWSCKRSPDTWSWIYFNVFIHVYSPRAGADNPLGTNCDVNRKPLSLYPFAASFKIISLKYDFKHILNDFIHEYSPRAGTDNPLGTKFWCQQKFLITLPICRQFKKNLFEVWFFTICMWVFFFTCIAPGRDRQPNWDKTIMTTERPFLFAHMLQVSKWSLQNLILYTFLMIYTCIQPRGKGIQPLGDKLLMSTESPYHFAHSLQVKKKRNLILYTF